MPSDETMLGKAYPDGADIIRQGDPGDCMFVVQSGTVEVVREEDGETTLLAELGPNDFFGEMSLFERETRSATVRKPSSAFPPMASSRCSAATTSLTFRLGRSRSAKGCSRSGSSSTRARR